MNDEDLVRDAQKGDKGAFNRLVSKYHSKMINLAGHLIRSEDDAPDVVQEAFIKAFRYLPNFRGDSLFSTWLYRIVTNCAHNWRKAQSIRVTQDLDSKEADSYGLISDPETPEQQAISSEVQALVMAAFDKIPKELRSALVLRELEGLDYEEIAVRLKCPVGTVRSRIFRGRMAFEEVFGDKSPFRRIE